VEKKISHRIHGAYHCTLAAIGSRPLPRCANEPSSGGKFGDGLPKMHACFGQSAMKSFQITFALSVTLCAAVASASSISNDSRLLAQCEFIYAYYGQLVQIQNNEGAAKAAVRRSTMMTTANLILNAENGIVASWKIREFTLLRDPIKRGFDSGTKDPLAATSDCDRNAIPIANRIRNSSQTLWGKSFDGLQLDLFEKSRKSLGL
jgi:hypothetical protein